MKQERSTKMPSRLFSPGFGGLRVGSSSRKFMITCGCLNILRMRTCGAFWKGDLGRMIEPCWLLMNSMVGPLHPRWCSHTPIWIQIHDMPLECMNRGVGRKVGETLGKVEEIDVVDDDVGWGS
jgi:hypothetical protein